MRSTRVLIWSLILAAAPGWAASYYTARLDDPKAVYLTSPGFTVHADGVGDDTAALQQAIDKLQETARPGGVVFIPEGRYRLTDTVYVWPSIRLIGYGAKRPVFVLGDNTPGYQDKNAEKYLIYFAGGRPGGGRGPAAPGAAPAGAAPGRGQGAASGRSGGGRASDAGAGTFYSAMSNIDVEIGAGNAGVSIIRSNYAQHSFLAHMEMRIGPGISAIHAAGNVVEDVRFIGGQYAVWTGRTSPGWQFTMVDSYFEGQRSASIRERQAGLTLVRPHFRNVPTAIEIEEGNADELFMKDGRLEDISGPALIISSEKSARSETNLEDTVCRNVPVFALLRESGKKTLAPGPIYAVKSFSHGLVYSSITAQPEIQGAFDAAVLSAMPAPAKSDLLALPPQDSWVNVHSLGVKGDGATDDTAALRKAIAENKTLYFPSGNYVIGDTLTLRPDTVLIGLHPNATQIDLLDSTPAFQGVDGPKAMVETPKGGTNIMLSIGVYTNGINPRAVAVKWMAGKDSLMNDVRFLGGHGTAKLDGSRENPYNNTHTADPDLRRRWDGQYPSLWVTNGGGGTFFDIWTPNTFSQAGMLVSDTSTEGRVYEMSSEHHVRHEIQLRNVSNWNIYALQIEAERGESGFMLPLEIENCSNITLANTHIYRVISSFQPFPYAIKVSGSKNIRIRSFHGDSNSKVNYDASVFDQTHNVELRQHEFAALDITGAPPAPRVKAASTLVAPAAKVEKLAGGFYNISGGAAAPNGDFYFVDAYRQRIYRWDAASKQLSTVRDNPLDPINLAFDKAGNLLVVSYAGNGTVYTFKADGPGTDITLLKPEPAAPRPGMTAVMAVGDYSVATPPRQTPFHYLSPDGSTFIPAGQDFVSGAVSWGIKSSSLLRGFGLAAAPAGKPFYITDEYNERTYSAMVGPDGSLSDMKTFVEMGGNGGAVDERGNVYLAAGQIYVYNPVGKLIDTIEVPQRPLQLVFGGKDGRTLFIAARDSLYSVRMQFKGR
jgi:sugar lactone lactonase YvrE